MTIPTAPPVQPRLAKGTPGKAPAETVSNPVQPVVNKQPPPPGLVTTSNSPPRSDGAQISPGMPQTPARQLLVEARQLQQQGRVLEARDKAVAAQKTGVVFAAGQDRPETILADLAQDADRQISSLLQDARTNIARGPADPNRYLQAEAGLNLARAMASSLRPRHADTIDGGLAQVHQLQAKAGPGP